jgi:hypothetical protein
MNFCLTDGASLLLTIDPSIQDTVIRPTPFIAPATETVRKGVNPLFAYLSVGVIAKRSRGNVGKV